MCVKVARVGGGAYLVSPLTGNTSGGHAGSLSAANKAASPPSFSLLWCKRGRFHLSGQAWLFRATDAPLSSAPPPPQHHHIHHIGSCRFHVLSLSLPSPVPFHAPFLPLFYLLTSLLHPSFLPPSPQYQPHRPAVM